MRCLPFLAVLLFAPAVLAQAPSALNAPPLPSAEAERLAAFRALLGRAGGTPDTTAPWRYYPLAVGNAWEYYDYATGHVTRSDVIEEVVLDDQRYFRLKGVVYDNGHVVSGGVVTVRYDTLTAFVLQREGDEEIGFGGAPCPLDADFGATVNCDPIYKGGYYDVTGIYDGAVVFGGASPAPGPTPSARP